MSPLKLLSGNKCFFDFFFFFFLLLSLCRLWRYWQVRTSVKRKMDSRPSEQISTAHRYTSTKTNRRQISDIIEVRLVCVVKSNRRGTGGKSSTCK